MSLPSLLAISWAEAEAKNLYSNNRSENLIVKPIPAYVVKQILENDRYDKRIPLRSERMYQLSKKILLKNNELLSDETTELAVYMFRQLEQDLHNMSLHRFFSRESFPSFLKYRGITSCDTREQQVSLMRTLKLEENIHTVLEEYEYFQKSLINDVELNVSDMKIPTQALIAHRMITEDMMKELLLMDSTVVNRCLAYNPDTPPVILESLAKQKRNKKEHDEITEIIIASHLNTSVETLNTMLKNRLHSKASKIILSERVEDANSLFQEYSQMTDLPWNALRGIAGNRNLSTEDALNFIESDLIQDFEIVYKLLSNEGIDGTIKELVKTSVQDYLIIH